jgi:hypothetical protein
MEKVHSAISFRADPHLSPSQQIVKKDGDYYHAQKQGRVPDGWQKVKTLLRF